MEPDPHRKADEKRHEARHLLFGALAVIAAGLLAIVVLVGLWRNNIDPTGTVSILAGVIGLIASLIVKGGGEK